MSNTVGVVGILAAFVLLFLWVSSAWKTHNAIERNRRETAELRKEAESIRNLAESDRKRIRSLETHMLRFTEPEAIADDMERTADLIEARMAGRQAAPRPGAAPNARISKLKNRQGKSGWDKSR
ncbi:hypothetical protein SEA_Phreeze_62 [Mycobacterium phage Phreeze]|nr:hypothetical protein SEA_THUMB_64 [Mycobacterium phage Thumb]AXH47188.1 hypothetical protein SEA_CBORCH11_65 [Mycobacterium phage Cborch11]QDH84926.1 hypothetical protein SEA_Phreeze_62 [Mycobacterium phage Phreeze]